MKVARDNVLAGRGSWLSLWIASSRVKQQIYMSFNVFETDVLVGRDRGLSRVTAREIYLVLPGWVSMDVKTID